MQNCDRGDQGFALHAHLAQDEASPSPAPNANKFVALGAHRKDGSKPRMPGVEKGVYIPGEREGAGEDWVVDGGRGWGVRGWWWWKG